MNAFVVDVSRRGLAANKRFIFMKTPGELEIALTMIREYVSESYLLPLTLQTAGPFLFILLQFSSLSTARKIHQHRSVGKLSPFPFISLITTGYVWCLYGLGVGDYTIFIPNFTAVVAGIMCAYAYHKFCGVKPVGYYVMTATIVGYTTLLAGTRQFAAVGTIGCILAVILAGSPLAVFQTVIRDKSTASLPFLTSLITWSNALAWASYGLLVSNDAFVYVPNFLGLLLGSIQMSLFMIYGITRSTPTKSAGFDTTDDDISGGSRSSGGDGKAGNEKTHHRGSTVVATARGSSGAANV